MSHDLVIIGAGGFGRETLDVVRAINAEAPTWRICGFVDDELSAINHGRLEHLKVPHLGGLDAIPEGASVAVAIGNPLTRRSVVEFLDARHPFPTLVHPTSILGSQLRHGDGLIVLGGVSIGTNVALGDHVHLNAHAVIGHDACLHDFVSVNPNATISGAVTIGSGSLIGAAAVVLQGLSAGQGSTIGAGSVLTKNLRGGVVKGVPARHD